MDYERIDLKYKEAQMRVNESMNTKLQQIHGIDIDALMSSIHNMLSVDRKVIHYDDSLIHIKVDRRKNINAIREQIQDEIEHLIGKDNVKILLKISVANNMVVIKRRR